jgi:hypothetical protein
MPFVLQPWHLLACIVAGYASREQQQVIDCLRTENAVLREKLSRRRLRLNDDQRRLAVKGKTQQAHRGKTSPGERLPCSDAAEFGSFHVHALCRHRLGPAVATLRTSWQVAGS